MIYFSIRRELSVSSVHTIDMLKAHHPVIGPSWSYSCGKKSALHYKFFKHPSTCIFLPPRQESFNRLKRRDIGPWLTLTYGNCLTNSCLAFSNSRTLPPRPQASGIDLKRHYSSRRHVDDFAMLCSILQLCGRPSQICNPQKIFILLSSARRNPPCMSRFDGLALTGKYLRITNPDLAPL